MLTREELEQEIAALERELKEREASLPVHSVRPGQIEAIEELEEQISEKRGLLKEVKVRLAGQRKGRSRRGKGIS